MAQDRHSVRIASDVSELAALRAFIQAACAELGVDADAVQDIMLAVNEAATNIIVHGYRAQPGVIDVTAARVDGQTLAVTLTDWAPLFDPTSIPPPDLARPLTMRPPGGMGIHMMRQLMDELRYAVTPDGRNKLCLLKEVALWESERGAM